MRNSSGHHERQGKKVSDNTYDISSIKRATKALFTRREANPGARVTLSSGIP